MTETGVPSASPSAAEAFSLRNLINIFRRRVRLFGGVALLVFLAALLVTARATPRYTAQAQVMLNVRQSQVLDSQQVLSNLPAETGVVDSEVEVLQSRDLARQVAEVLRLENDPEFNWVLREPGGLGAFIAKVQGKALPRPTPPTTPEAIQLGRERAASALRGGLTVQRMGLTYIIGVNFTSLNPEKSARIANAFAGQYIANQVSDKGGANRQANTFLEARLNQLRGEVQSAEAAVEAYRSANNLLTSSGATLTEQEVSTYNQQLATAQADQAVEEARLRAARSQLARGSTGGDVGEALQSSVVGQLRGQRSTVAARVADLQARYGPEWPALLRARQELAAIDGQIQAEIQRVISNLEARVQVARDRTASLQSTLGRTRGTLASNNAASVRLNELERNAQSVRTLYEGLLERYQETTNQSGNETADSRLLQALGCGLAAVVLVELMDDGLITSEDVQRRLGLPMLGTVPLMMSIADRKDRRMAPTEYLLNRPLSAFAESFRTLRTSIMYAKLGSSAKVVVVTSALPGEGKTTTAVCLAISAAQAGLKVVIVDCDIRRRNVSRLLGVDADHGLLDVLDGSMTLADVLLKGEASGAWVLPTAKRDFTPREVFNTPEMAALLSRLREDFDMVILDTAPVLAVAETRVLASQADAVMFLTRWRKTPAKAAEAALRSLEQSDATVAGAVLTQVDMQEQARYGYGDPGYYYTAYKGYYTN